MVKYCFGTHWLILYEQKQFERFLLCSVEESQKSWKTWGEEYDMTSNLKRFENTTHHTLANFVIGCRRKTKRCTLNSRGLRTTRLFKLFRTQQTQNRNMHFIARGSKISSKYQTRLIPRIKVWSQTTVSGIHRDFQSNWSSPTALNLCTGSNFWQLVQG